MKIFLLATALFVIKEFSIYSWNPCLTIGLQQLIPDAKILKQKFCTSNFLCDSPFRTVCKKTKGSFLFHSCLLFFKETLIKSIRASVEGFFRLSRT